MKRIPNWSQILRSDFTSFITFKDFLKIAKTLNYPYFVWDNKLYNLHPNGENIKIDYLYIEGNKIYVEEPEGEF